MAILPLYAVGAVTANQPTESSGADGPLLAHMSRFDGRIRLVAAFAIAHLKRPNIHATRLGTIAHEW
jgi:hypothetical protein